MRFESPYLLRLLARLFKLVAALRRKGTPVGYLLFSGEQHGFRKQESIVRCLEAELYFYGAVLAFAPADTLPSVTIAHLDQWQHRQHR